MAYRAGSQDLTSSEDDSDKDWDKSPKSKKRRMSKVLEDTIAANDDDIDDASEDDEELNNSNRMTPSIEKAIQRSISKLSQENLDLDADEKKSSPNDHSYCVSKSPILFEDDDDFIGGHKGEEIDGDHSDNVNDSDHLDKSSYADQKVEAIDVDSFDESSSEESVVDDSRIEDVQTTHYKIAEEAPSLADQVAKYNLKVLKVMVVRNDGKVIIPLENGTENEPEENISDKLSQDAVKNHTLKKFKLIERRASDVSNKSSRNSVTGSPREVEINCQKLSNSQEKKSSQTSYKELNNNDVELKRDDKILIVDTDDPNTKIICQEINNNSQKLSTDGSFTAVVNDLVKIEMKNETPGAEGEEESKNILEIKKDEEAIEAPDVKDIKPKINIKPTTDHSTRDLGKKALETYKEQQSLTVERLHDLHGSLISRPTESTRAKDPAGLSTPLMPHQQHALAWLLWREQQKPPGGVLADEMGLGKTLTMISLVLKTLPEFRKKDEDKDKNYRRCKLLKYSGGTLVVCPASLVSQWSQEIRKHCKRNQLVFESYHGPNREVNIKKLSKNDIVITTYNLLSRESNNTGISNLLYKIQWERVILDEAHVVRNHKSQMCDAVCRLTADRRWAITGTPIHNKQMDLYAILKFLQCSPFDDLRIWKRWVDNKDDAGHQRLTTVMKTLMLRRTKQELMIKGEMQPLTKKILNTIRVPLDADERLVYEKVLMYSRTLFAQFLHQRSEKHHMFEMGARYDHRRPTTSPYIAGFNKAQQQLLAQHADVQSHDILVLLLRLRQICCHPSLIHAMLDKNDLDPQALGDGAINFQLLNQINNVNLRDDTGNDPDDEDEEESGVSERVIENLLTKDNPVFDPERQSAKLRSIITVTKQILTKKEKVIIVSQWVGYLQIIANNLNSIDGATYKLFIGSTSINNRQKMIDSFNSPDEDPQILLLSLNAGGVGLNLMGGNHLMLIDIHWNPQLELQAQDRIHRFGQKKNVFIYKFICSDTIEERIESLQQKKLKISGEILSGSGKVSTKLTIDDLRSLFNI
ncbi:transcription termination factor 2 [Microplitis demolitor]|uniref:transcription termination factor 2 n=1 Tax=Microplitis demolitor TaxID=69319 RepID=UPI0004CCAF04|nr:transcription termination factor 2 [Microplitis demolitor]